MGSDQTELLLLLRLLMLHTDPSHHLYPFTFPAYKQNVTWRFSWHLLFLQLNLYSPFISSKMEGTRIRIRDCDEALVSLHHPLAPYHTLAGPLTSAGSHYMYFLLLTGMQLSWSSSLTHVPQKYSFTSLLPKSIPLLSSCSTFLCTLLGYLIGLRNSFHPAVDILPLMIIPIIHDDINRSV